ncbi:stalk domain-containing protein [Paenibacillus sp. 22594]|uniref:stalk domain-containing protein n=1 Tax=Paenibacillus sp. 22594 TaxID=3453947 RepID=UPI003F82D8CC
MLSTIAVTAVTAVFGLPSINVTAAGATSTSGSAAVATSTASAASKLSGIQQIVASAGFWGGSSFALGKDGSVWVWGSNVYGQFANGTAGPQGWTITPHRIEALDHTRQLLIGYGYYLALREEGTVTVWGAYAKEDNISVNQQSVVQQPQTIPGLTDIVKITSNTGGMLALKKDGTLLQWTAPDRTAAGYAVIPPANPVKGISGVNDIAGGAFQAALKDNGTLWVWQPASGVAPSKTLPLSPTPVSNLYHVKSIVMDGASLLAVTKSGTVWGSVDGDVHDLSKLVVKKMAGLSGIVNIDTGNGFNVVRNKKGEYWLWTSGTHLSSLQKVTSLNGLAKLSLGLDGFVGVKKDGTVWTWGKNYATDSKLTFTTPKQIKGLQSPVSITSGENSRYAVLKDGTAVAWGTNMFGQLGISVLESRPFRLSPILKPITLVVNGKTLEAEQPPIYANGRLMLPVRAISESLGYTVAWDGGTKLTRNGKSLLIRESQIQLADGNRIAMTPLPVKVSYTELVPASALIQSLRLSVIWDSKNSILTLREAGNTE